MNPSAVTLAEAWRRRFGSDPPAVDGFPAGFITHRSVREYADRPVPEDLVACLIGCGQGASTSSNLQLWSVVSVQDPLRREEVARLCGGQRHVRNAPWFLAFLADHHRLRQAAGQVGEEALGLDYFEFLLMAIVDASLAAERLVCAAESVGLGACYIGALRNDPVGVKEFLGLPSGTVGLFGLCLGWPVKEAADDVKPRLPQPCVWHRERYPDTVSIGDYDDRMRVFYEQQGMKADVTWSMRSGRRVDEKHLTGREALRPFLDGQGMGKR